MMRVALTILLIGSLLPISHAVAQNETSPKTLLEQVGHRSGICVLLGEALGPQAIQLARSSKLTILVQTPDREDVRLAQRQLAQTGLLGHRVIVDWGTDQIHLGNNLANAIHVQPGLVAVPDDEELMRALQPRGRLVIDGKVRRKPVPVGTGEWTHPYHAADNNPLSEDTVIRAPYLTQFLATPWYGPMPEITLSSGGRIFKAFGHLAFKQREWPMLGKLVCMDAYNGAMLWQRELMPGFMIHRSTMVATPEVLYVGDNDSCKRIDAATGEVIDQLKLPEGLSKETSWKWMTLKDGVLYALLGPKETLHPVHKGTRTQTGWPWTTVRSTYGPVQTTWGFGQTLLAWDLEAEKVRWHYQAPDPIDSRAVCMNGESVLIYSHRKWLAAVDRNQGTLRWKRDDAELLDLIGEHERAQTAPLGYATSAYAKCNDQVWYFAGPQRKRLVAVSAEDGRLLWSFHDGNVQLILRPDGLYAMGRMNSSKKFGLVSGEVLAELQCFRGNCTRATGTADSIFARGYRHSGTLRYDLGYEQPHRLPAMRPACQDGVIAANGLLYWGPWMCDCNHSLVGVISLGSAGAFDFVSKASDAQRLQSDANVASNATGTADDRDWPTYRANNQRTAFSAVEAPQRATVAWQTEPQGTSSAILTAPIAVGDRVFAGSDRGAVQAWDATSGKLLWTTHTGGAIHYPPAYDSGRLYVGSADGWAYCLDASSGKQRWRFRAAPKEQRIPVYGQLSSRWPVASGVLVEDHVAYLAAGIVSHDGTHVYALDADRGTIRWQNNVSGNLSEEREVVGVSVQGHMLMHNDTLYMAGGNVVSPAMYDVRDGRCLNKLEGAPDKTLDDHWKMQRSSRGSELYLVEDRVVVGGRMLYSPSVAGPPSRYNANYVLQAGKEILIQGNNEVLMRIEPRGEREKARILWQEKRLAETAALALAKNAILVAGQWKADEEAAAEPVVAALDADSGKLLWRQPLPAPARPWGLALDRRGQVLVALNNGQLLCLGASAR